MTIYEAGKQFLCTGWVTGWVIGPPHLVKAVSSVHTAINYNSFIPAQLAFAHALGEATKPYKGHFTFYEYV